MPESTRYPLASLSRAQKLRLLKETVTDREARLALAWRWDFVARPNQLQPEGDWRIWLVLAGRGFGKTRIGAEWVREQVREFGLVNLIGPTAADVRDVMIEGPAGIMACSPQWERPEYLRSRRLLKWPNGARSLCFSAEDPESLRGPQHERLWGDELRAWPYMRETYDMAMLGLRVGSDPRALLTSTPRPVALLRELIEDPKVIVSKGTTYENRENLAEAFFEQTIRRYEGTRLGRQELDAELLLDEGLAYQLKDGVHVVPPIAVPDWWGRFEAMDYGTSAPTSWGCFAADHESNVYALGLHHEPGFPSETAPKIHAAHERWWAKDTGGKPVPAICFGPADIRTKWRRELSGKELSAETEFNDHGLYFSPAQQDRRAGYIRIAEMLRCDETRPFPDWHPKARELGAPRFYIADTDELAPLIEAVRDAPLEDPDNPISKLPGEAVDEQWEHDHGHAHAMLRYALLSRPLASEQPKVVPDDPRAARLEKRLEWLDKRAWEDLVNV